MKSLDEEVVVFPPHLTDVIQRLHEAAIRAMKASFSKEEENWKRRIPQRAPSPADFVQLWTYAYADTVTPQKIL